MEEFENRLGHLGDLLESAEPGAIRNHSPMRSAQYMTRAAAEYFVGTLTKYLETHSPREARDAIRPVNAFNTNTLAQFSAELESPLHRRHAQMNISPYIAAEIEARGPVDHNALLYAAKLAVAAGYTRRQIITMAENTFVRTSDKSR